MSDLPTVYGFVYTDADGNPRLPTVSFVDPKTDPYVTEPYRLIYIGDNQQDCIDAIKASIVIDNAGEPKWSEAAVAKERAANALYDAAAKWLQRQGDNRETPNRGE